MSQTRVAPDISPEDKTLLAEIKKASTVTWNDDHQNIENINLLIFNEEAFGRIELLFNTVSTEFGLGEIVKHWRKVLAARMTLLSDEPSLQYQHWGKSRINKLCILLAKFCERKLGGHWLQYLYPSVSSVDHLGRCATDVPENYILSDDGTALIERRTCFEKAAETGEFYRTGVEPLQVLSDAEQNRLCESSAVDRQFRHALHMQNAYRHNTLTLADCLQDLLYGMSEKTIYLAILRFQHIYQKLPSAAKDELNAMVFDDFSSFETLWQSIIIYKNDPPCDVESRCDIRSALVLYHDRLTRIPVDVSLCDKEDWQPYLADNVQATLLRFRESSRQLPDNSEYLMLQHWCQRIDFVTFYFFMTRFVKQFESAPRKFFKLPLITCMTDYQLQWFSEKYEEKLLKPALDVCYQYIRPAFYRYDYKDDQALLGALLSIDRSQLKNENAIDNLCQTLAMRQVDSSALDMANRSLFMRACHLNPLTARRMLPKFKGNINEKSVSGETALNLAATAGDAVLVSELVKRGANTEDCKATGYASLELALHKNDVPVVKVLFDPAKHVTEQLLRCVSLSNNTATVEFLYPHIEHMLDTLITYVASANNEEVLKYLLKRMDRATCLRMRDALNAALNTYIDICTNHVVLGNHRVFYEDYKIVGLLLQFGARCSDEKFNGIITAAMTKVLRQMDDNRDVIKETANLRYCSLALLLIISRKSVALPRNVEIPVGVGICNILGLKSDMHIFAYLAENSERAVLEQALLTFNQWNDVTVFQCLWALPSDITRELVNRLFDKLFAKYYHVNSSKNQPVDWNLKLAEVLHHLPKTQSDHPTFPFVLFLDGINYNYVYQDCSLLMLAMLCDSRIYLFLIEQNVEIDWRNSFGETALMAGARAGRCVLVMDLLEREANPHIKNCAGDSAFTIAIKHKKFEMATYLMRVSSAFRQITKKHEQVEWGKYLIQDCSGMNDFMHEANLFGETAVTLICEHYDGSHPDFLAELIKSGFDINSRHPVTGRTMLMEAAVRGKSELVHFLLSNGARTDITSTNGKTVFAYAKASRNQFTEQLLARYQQDKKVLDVFTLQRELIALKTLTVKQQGRFGVFAENDPSQYLAGAKRIATQFIAAIDDWMLHADKGADATSYLFKAAEKISNFDLDGLANPILKAHLTTFLGKEGFSQLREIIYDRLYKPKAMSCGGGF